MSKDKLTEELLVCSLASHWHCYHKKCTGSQAFEQIKEKLQQKPTVTRKEIENAVGDTSDEYTEGVVELFESKGFEVEMGK